MTKATATAKGSNSARSIILVIGVISLKTVGCDETVSQTFHWYYTKITTIEKSFIKECFTKSILNDNSAHKFVTYWYRKDKKILI